MKPDRKAIPLSQFNASEPGQHWVKWADELGYAVEGWRTKVEGIRHQGRDPGSGDKGVEWAKEHYRITDFGRGKR
jgi:hypothetical protein